MSNLAKKLGSILAAVTMAAAVVTPGLAAPAHGGATLLVYTHLQQSEAAVIANVAKGWESKTGNTIKIVVDKGSFQDFTTLARTGKGPDVMFGLPHDNMGTYQLAGLVQPLPSGLINLGDYVPLAQPAVSYGGKPYSVPLLVETTTLNYNKRLVPTAPKTWDDVIRIASKFGNKRGQPFGILWDIKNYYFSYAFISGLGGYTFKNNGGAYDTSDVGLANTGAVAGLTLLRDAVLRYKLIPSSIDYGTAQSLFQKGQVGMFIDGTWDIGANQKALGKDFATATLPLLPGGKIAHPYSGVQVAFVSAFSKQQAMAFDFLKYMAPRFGLPDWQVSGRFPALKSDLDNPKIQSDPIEAAFAKELTYATPMPNVAAMNAVWTPAGNALTLVVTGKSAPSVAAANMVKQIKQGIAQQTQ